MFPPARISPRRCAVGDLRGWWVFSPDERITAQVRGSVGVSPGKYMVARMCAVLNVLPLLRRHSPYLKHCECVRIAIII